MKWGYDSYWLLQCFRNNRRLKIYPWQPDEGQGLQEGGGGGGETGVHHLHRVLPGLRRMAGRYEGEVGGGVRDEGERKEKGESLVSGFGE